MWFSIDESKAICRIAGALGRTITSGDTAKFRTHQSGSSLPIMNATCSYLKRFKIRTSIKTDAHGIRVLIS